MRLGAALQEILDCAATELEEAGRTVPDDVFISPGQVAFDNPCGQLWTRVIRGHLTLAPPTRELTSRPCGHPVYMLVGLGIIRCQTGVERINEEKYPTPDEQNTDALGLICDQGALLRALACCVVDDRPDVIIEQWTQLEPQGGVIGGEWQAWVESDLYCEETSP